MEDILIYSTTDGVWTLNHTNTDTISERYLHTATLCKNKSIEYTWEVKTHLFTCIYL
jgi:hypothetical protein